MVKTKGKARVTAVPGLTEDGALKLKDATPDNPVMMQVVELLRYTVDERFLSMTQETLDPHDSDAFDIVITDGLHKRKCVLSTKYNKMAKRGEFQGRTIHIHECLAIQDDTVTPMVEILLLSKIVISPKSAPKATGSVFPNVASVKEKSPVPLCGSRKYYLYLYNDDDHLPTDGRWFASDIPEMDGLIEKEDLTPLKEVVEKFTSGTRKVLLGRVFKKSRLFHYGKKTDRKDSFPMTFSFLLGDASCSLELTVWNELCIDLFESLDVGKLLYIDNYKVQKAQNKPFGVRVGLNPSGPRATVKTFSETNIDFDSEDFEKMFPPVEHSFALGHRIIQLADEMELDIVGVIVYAGRIQRERNRNGTFAETRWVGLLLTEEESPVFLKLYTCSQVQAFNRVQVGGVLFASKVKVCSYTPGSFKPRVVFLLTTSTTHLLVWEDLESADADVNIPPYLAKINLESRDKQKKIGAGGFFELTFPFPNLSAAKAEYGEDLLTPFEELENIKGRLEYLEKKTVILQGYISEIHFGVQKKVPEASSSKDKKKKSESQSQNKIFSLRSLDNCEIVYESSNTLSIDQSSDTLETPVSLTFVQSNEKKGLKAFAPGHFVGPVKYNTWIDGFCDIFPENLRIHAALDESDPFGPLLQSCKAFLSGKKVAVLAQLYRSYPEEVEIVITKILPL